MMASDAFQSSSSSSASSEPCDENTRTTQPSALSAGDVSRIDAVLTFWLGDPSDPIAVRSQRWWQKDPAFDRRCASELGRDLERAACGELDAWRSDPRGALALVILLDQLSRNIHRDHPDAFAHDQRAREVARQARARGFDRHLNPIERSFLYMPFIHAEDGASQTEGVAAFTELAAGTTGEARPLMDRTRDYAVQHRQIIERFGRFPHRNAILGRPTTDEEAFFLTQPGSSF
jgi:uncharacterized protein (DUF924 family)